MVYTHRKNCICMTKCRPSFPTKNRSIYVYYNLQEENEQVASSKSFNFRAISDDVFNALQTKDTSKATGADNISPKILKIAVPYISNVVAKIFNASYKQGH